MGLIKYKACVGWIEARNPTPAWVTLSLTHPTFDSTSLLSSESENWPKCGTWPIGLLRSSVARARLGGVAHHAALSIPVAAIVCLRTQWASKPMLLQGANSLQCLRQAYDGSARPALIGLCQAINALLPLQTIAPKLGRSVAADWVHPQNCGISSDNAPRVHAAFFARQRSGVAAQRVAL